MPGENNIFNIGQFLSSRKAPEHPTLAKNALKLAADEQRYESFVNLDKSESVGFVVSYSKELIRTALHLLAMKYTMGISEIERMSLPAAVAEIFGYDLSKYVDLSVAPVEVYEHEPEQSGDFIKKRGDLFIASKRVEKSLPIFYLKVASKIPPGLENPVTKTGAEFHRSLDESLRTVFYSMFNKSCPMLRSDYKDFPVESETDPVVLGAARWNSIERLATYAFRYLFYFSYPHSSNVLVDIDGNLTLIDHEKIVYRADTSDIRELYEAVCQSERVMNVCRHFSNLSERAIEDSLRGIDSEFWRHEQAVFMEPAGAIEYFKRRLRAWRHYFKPIDKQARKNEFGFIPYQNAGTQYPAL